MGTESPELGSGRCDLPEQSGLRVLAVGLDSASTAGIENCVATSGGHFEIVSSAPQACRCLGCAKWDVLAPLVEPTAEHELDWWANALRDLATPPRLIPLSRNASQELVDRAALLGVPDVVPVPIDPERFLRAAGREIPAAEDAIPLPAAHPITIGSRQLIVSSPGMMAAYRTITQVAASSATILIVGESGTGKEIAARAIHQHSPRANGPFVAVNCAAIPENLLENELFGHEKGAFTGAVSRQIGRWERAHGGTLFLDEISDLPLPLQGKILRVVQENEVERLGGGGPIAANVRIVAATNRDLREAVAEGRFRQDLYYRLAVVTVSLPPLAERGDDLLLLAAHFLSESATANDKTVSAISAKALRCLRRHNWPGNIRELQNVLETAVLLMTGDVLKPEHLPAYLHCAHPIEIVSSRRASAITDRPAEFPSLSLLEANYIAQVLRHTDGQLLPAARILGIHRNTLTRKIRQYGLA